MEGKCWSTPRTDRKARERASKLEPFLGSKTIEPVERVRH